MESCRRILLVGFMGSGKSTVGSLLAARLGWAFFDFDAEIERHAGLSVEEIFRTLGEAHFRDLEARVGRTLLETDRAVLASGGGWPAPGRMATLDRDTLSVWLGVSPETALARTRLDGRARPLLQGADGLAKARRLLSARASSYGRAHLHLDTEATSPEELAERIHEHLEAADRNLSKR